MRKAAVCLLLASLAVICISVPAFSQAPAATAPTFRGDINEDGQVNIFDLLELLKILANPLGITERTLQIADVDAGGSVDNFDVLSLLKVLSGSEQPGIISWPAFSLTGTIEDQQPRGLSGASVHITGNGVDTTLFTDSDGFFTLSGLSDGIYTVTPAKDGFWFNPESSQVSINGADGSFYSRAWPSGGAAPGDTTVVQGITFVSIPGGTFQMGGTMHSGEQPIHSVTVSAFQMSAKEITNSQYATYLNTALAAGEIRATASKVTGAKGDYSGQMYIELSGKYDSNNKCWISYSGTSFSAAAGKENWPVVYVSWYGSKAFAVKYGFDLPREGEWEYAARGGKGYEFGTDDGTISISKANHSSDVGYPTNVGSYPVNPFGLYDLSGNVWEWCNDYYESYSSENATDPQGALVGSGHVGRGGSWYHGYDGCRSARRYYDPAYARGDRLGFRVVRR